MADCPTQVLCNIEAHEITDGKDNDLKIFISPTEGVRTTDGEWKPMGVANLVGRLESLRHAFLWG